MCQVPPAGLVHEMVHTAGVEVKIVKGREAQWGTHFLEEAHLAATSGRILPRQCLTGLLQYCLHVLALGLDPHLKMLLHLHRGQQP